MPNMYAYTARTMEGEKRTGVIQADSTKRVADILAEQLLIPTDIKAQRKLAQRGFMLFMKSRLYEELIVFTRNFATLFRAGIPILRSLRIIKVGDENSYFNRALSVIHDAVQSGRSFSDALSDFPKLFPQVYIASIAAGETSGNLDEVLDSLGFMLEKDLELNRQIKASLRYPIAVVSAIIAAFMIMIIFVIPRFVQFYGKMGADLPLPTRFLIWLNEAVTSYGIVILAGIAVLILIYRKIYRTTAGRYFFDNFFLRIPIFGDLIIKGSIARLSYMFNILIKSGIPIVKSLDMLYDVVKNARLISEVRLLSELFSEGREETILLQKMVFFPQMALQMIMIGLESGALDKMLLEVANHYGKEVDYKSKQLTTLLEPILTIVLGIFVLIVALAIFLPMWNLIKLFHP